jgi:hypothetical protein
MCGWSALCYDGMSWARHVLGTLFVPGDAFLDRREEDVICPWYSFLCVLSHVYGRPHLEQHTLVAQSSRGRCTGQQCGVVS